MATSDEAAVVADYVSSLADLTVNSKPHINVLTMLAEEYVEHAPAIVKAVENHLEKVSSETKLPVLYLIDSIIKNVASDYKNLFTQNIANTFCNAFEKVDEKTRANLFKLRQTWNDVIPAKKLYFLDTKVNMIDPAWPITAPPPKIHVNPRFLNTNSPTASSSPSPAPVATVTPAVTLPTDTTVSAAMKEQLLQKKKKLLELQQEKLRLELLQTQAHLEEQQKMLEKQTGHLKSEKLQQKKVKLELMQQTQAHLEEQKKQLAKQSSDNTTSLQKLMQKFTNKDTNKLMNKSSTKKANNLSPAQATPSKSSVKGNMDSPKNDTKVAMTKAAITSKTDSLKINSKPESMTKQSFGKSSDLLLKPFATAELNTSPSKRSSPTKNSKSTKTFVVKVDISHQVKSKPQPMTQVKPETLPTDMKPVVLVQPRIAPVSSQLISAARRTRDPRIFRRQMEEPQPEPPPKPPSPPKIELSPKPKQKVTFEDVKLKTSQSKSSKELLSKPLTQQFKPKSKKDKKSSRHSKEERQNRIYQIVHDIRVSKSKEAEKVQSSERNISSASKSIDLPSIDSAEERLFSKGLSKTMSPVRESVEKQDLSINSDKKVRIEKSDPKVEIIQPVVNKEIEEVNRSSPAPSQDQSLKLKVSKETDIPTLSPAPLKDLPIIDTNFTSENNEPKTKSMQETLSSEVSEIAPSSPSAIKVAPIPNDKKFRSEKGEPKVKVIQQILSSREVDEASPSPPPPPVISDKFKEVKRESLSRLRQVGRKVHDSSFREGSESPPATGDVDLRHALAPLSDENKKEIVGNAAISTEKDVDLRQFPVSPTKKRPSVERTEAPPSKKSKAEMFDELFGKEDVDLRPLLPPSPPPPPVISLSPPPPIPEVKDSGLERSWAKYKQQKPETFKSPYRQTPLKSPSFKKDYANTQNWRGRGKPYPYNDTDMRYQFEPGPTPNYDVIIRQANEQYTSGSLTDNEYKIIVNEVITMNEKRQVEEAKRLDEEEMRKEEELEPISDDEISAYSESPPMHEDTSSLNADDVLPKGNEKEFSSINEENRHPLITDNGDAKESTFDLSVTDVDQRIYADDDKSNNKVTRTLTESHSPRTHVDSVHERQDVSESREPERKRFHRERDRREEHRLSRYDQKLRRRMEGRENRMFRKTRFGQGNSEDWEAPFDIRHPDVRESNKSPVEMDHSGHESYNPPEIPRPVVLGDKGNFGEGEVVMTHNLHPMRFSGDSKADSHEQSHVRAPGPWDPRHPVGTPWMRNIPPLMPPSLMRMPVEMPRFGPGPRWRAPMPPIRPLRPPFEGDGNVRFNRFPLPSGSPRPQALALGELPPADPIVLDLIASDPTHCINIDGKSKDIRFYGDTAVAMMEWDDPREISFQGGQRRIIIDDRDSMMISFNTPYRDMLIDGQPHRVRFGAPTRELYIDGKWYECYFGGPPISVEISGKMRSVQLEGPPPQVRTGVQRKDLVLGRVRLIVDAKYIYDLYLDPKPQRFDIEGTPIIIRFVEALRTLVINGVSFKSDFGGLPKPFFLKGKKHFFRLSTLPQGIRPGYLTIVNMEGGRLQSPPPAGVLPAPPQIPLSLQNLDMDIGHEGSNDSPHPMIPPSTAPSLPVTVSPCENEKTESAVVPETLHHPPPPVAQNTLPQTQLPPANPLDMLASLLPPAPASRTSSYSYSVEAEPNVSTDGPPATTTSQPSTTTVPFFSSEVNVAELLQKLIATGIVSNTPATDTPAATKEKSADANAIIPVDFSKPETLKTRQPGIITAFYSGIQCSSCGVRFPPEQTMKYSQHLDWHFRQNRRDKDSARMAQSRKWYYDISDWIQFEEIEDLEDRAQSWFELSQAGQNSNGAETEEPPGEVPSVAAGESPENAACEICRDKFEQFFNEEREEWHLRQAIRVDDKLYHPICYQDYRASLDAPIEVSLDESEDTKEDDEVIPIEKPPAVVEEVDDDILEVIEYEIVPQVFPIEDLTTSDCESVVDATEAKPDLLKEELMEVEKDKELDPTKEVEETNEQIPSLEKDKGNDTNDVMVEDKDKIEDITTIDVEAVVKNIKQEPLDDEILDSEMAIKKEREEIDIPEPIVDTTHAAVECSIDGNLQFDDSPQIAVSAPPKIKINITKPLTLQVAATRDSKESESDVTDSETPITTPSLPLSVFNTIEIQQPPPPGEEPGPLHLKPRLLGKKLQDLPPLTKGKELSGLCSIM